MSRNDATAYAYCGFVGQCWKDYAAFGLTPQPGDAGLNIYTAAKRDDILDKRKLEF